MATLLRLRLEAGGDRDDKLPCVLIDQGVVLGAVGTSRKHKLSLWDSLILVAASRGGCSTVVTEDLQDGFRLDSVRVKNPFAG